MPPANGPVKVGAGGNHAPGAGSACCMRAADTPASTRMKPSPISRMRSSFSVERSTSPIGVAPPVNEDCAPTTRSVGAARTIAGISAIVRGTRMSAACPPGKRAASERYLLMAAPARTRRRRRGRLGFTAMERPAAHARVVGGVVGDRRELRVGVDQVLQHDPRGLFCGLLVRREIGGAEVRAFFTDVAIG